MRKPGITCTCYPTYSVRLFQPNLGNIYTHTCKIYFITSLRFIFQKKKQTKNKSSKLLYQSYKSNYYIFWQHHKKNQKASSTWLTICRWMDLVRSSVLESSSINNFLLISVALKDIVLLWDAVTHKHKNLSMSKRRWSCFDR